MEVLLHPPESPFTNSTQFSHRLLAKPEAETNSQNVILDNHFLIYSVLIQFYGNDPATMQEVSTYMST